MLCSPRSSRTGTPSSQTSNLREWELECWTFFDLLKLWTLKFKIHSLGGGELWDNTSGSNIQVEAESWWEWILNGIYGNVGQTLSVLKEKYRKSMTNRSKKIPNQDKVKMTLTAVCNEVYCPDGHNNQANLRSLHHCGWFSHLKLKLA